MSNIEILEQALRLRPDERIAVVDGLLKSLDVPDEDLDRIWTEEALRRLTAYRAGELKAIPLEEIFVSE